MENKGSGLENEKKELCDRCRSIPETTFFSSGKPRTGSRFEFGPTEPYELIEGPNAFEELKLSAATGCGLCKLFQNALEIGINHPDRQWWEEGGIMLRRNSPDNIEIAFGRFRDHGHDTPLVILTNHSTTRSIEPASYLIETESDSAANFALARSWLVECCKSHVECQDSLEFELPRRLLDVAMPSRPGSIRLVSALDLPAKVRAYYAALSHCWGSFWPLQTRTDNFRNHVQEIPESRLPQTFHDAVRTTRELGLRYLWIDSLCIVQDNPMDFEAECARMNTIFANALCTISASDAGDCRDGLFQSRTIKPVRLTYESDGFEPTLTVIMQPAFHESWMQGLQGPLQSRAWVLQERHLSPRIIHYTKKCLMWECRTATASEHQQKMQAKSDAHRNSNYPDLSSNRFLDGGRSKLEPEDTSSCLRADKFETLHDRWYGIVEDYSNRVISHPEDRLPAISGFAAEWKRMKPEDEYFAGLWKSDIFNGLAWFPSFSSLNATRRLPKADATWPPSSPFKGIPSWSWAAFEGPVAYIGQDWFDTNFHDFDLDMSTLVEGHHLPPPASCALRLHDVTTTIEQLNPFGRVSKGEITVSSWSIVVTLSESDCPPGPSRVFEEDPKPYHLHPDLKSFDDGTVYFDHDPFYLPQTQVRLLQLGMGTTVYGKWACVCGLVLLQVKIDELTSNQELYRRVGMFHLDDYPFWLLRREWKTVTVI